MAINAGALDSLVQLPEFRRARSIARRLSFEGALNQLPGQPGRLGLTTSGLINADGQTETRTSRTCIILA